MSHTEIVLRVFVAAPAELKQEIAVLLQTIEELNSLWARKLGLRLDPIGWQTHAYPAFAEDAQAAINAQISQDFDLFVGLMWTRFGSPTSRAGSGTAEEFDLALARFRQDPDSVRLMMYFKDAPRPPSEIDPTQLLAVNEFRARIQREGGLHWSFTSTEDFAVNVRIHFTRFIQEWAQRHGASRASTVVDALTVESVQQSDGYEEEAGFFDLVEQATQNITVANDIMTRLTNFSQELTESVNKRTAEMSELYSSEATQSPSAYKSIASHLAVDMEQYVRRARAEIPEFGKQIEAALAATGQAASLTLDFGSASAMVAVLPALATQVESFGAVLSDNAKSIRQFRNFVLASPRMTTAYNRARRATGDMLEELARTMETAAETCQKVSIGIRAISSNAVSDPNAGNS